MVRWLVTTIEEPFPVFFSHVDYPNERRRETARGPFVAAGSVYYNAASERAFVERQVAALREAGWTVTIREEER